MRTSLNDLAGQRVLLVASTGGHLQQLSRLAPRLGLGEGCEWVTFDTPQSRSLLAGQTVHYVPYVAPRDWRNIIRAYRATRTLRREFDATLSTGAGLALGVLPSMAAKGKKAVFIESISRVQGPSVTGRILSRLPRIGLYAQHGWAYGPWRKGPSVLSLYRASEPADAPRPARRIFVTLGTIKPYRFDRLVELVTAYASQHEDVEVRWQLGCTTRDDLPGEVHTQMGSDEFAESIAWADVVVSHAGVGICMNILDGGKIPVLLPREVAREEHVDDHQREIFDYLLERNLAADAREALASREALERVAAITVVSNEEDMMDQTNAQQPETPQASAEHRAGQPVVEHLTRLTDPLRNTLRPLHRRIAASLPLYWRRQYLYFAAMLHFGHFNNPRTYTEKINWRIIHDRRPELVRVTDKLEMKKLARELVPDPERLRIPETLWVGTNVDEIPDELLSQRLVLKPNDGCGDVLFLPATRDEVREATADWLDGEQSEQLGEWAYSQARRLMFIEERVPGEGAPNDYKFKVFDSEAVEVEVHTGRFDDHRCSHYDRDWNKYDVEASYIPAAGPLPRPALLDEMFQVASDLGKGWDFMRVDLYEANGEIWFGEYSCYPSGGVIRFVPKSFDDWMGSLWTLPSLDEVRG
ncbi:ATP-grasp fold amidoligase family protein [Luteococcus sp. OSA5]|uniref:ATP-grasp fold amidoligase family protein n=1 Tax=Luteococcus sp. OSA5 TaxID=3401630 RepID=UPI003B43B540